MAAGWAGPVGRLRRTSGLGPPGWMSTWSSSIPSACRRASSAGRPSSGCSPMRSTSTSTRPTKRSAASRCRPISSCAARASWCSSCRATTGPGHAGSRRRGRSGCNDCSVGIELEGLAGGTFEAVQYRELVLLLGDLVARYPITDIAGHEHVAPGRKGRPRNRLRLASTAPCSAPSRASSPALIRKLGKRFPMHWRRVSGTMWFVIYVRVHTL